MSHLVSWTTEAADSYYRPSALRPWSLVGVPQLPKRMWRSFATTSAKLLCLLSAKTSPQLTSSDMSWTRCARHLRHHLQCFSAHGILCCYLQNQICLARPPTARRPHLASSRHHPTPTSHHHRGVTTTTAEAEAASSSTGFNQLQPDHTGSSIVQV
jgi:hypothetical protein